MRKTLLALSITLISAVPVKAQLRYSPPRTFSPVEVPTLTTNNQALMGKAMLEFASLDYDAAERDFRSAIASTSDPAILSALRIQLLTVLKVAGNTYVYVNPQKAIGYLHRAITLQPTDYFLYARLGDAFCDLRQLQPCLASHDRSIELNPDKREGLQRKAIALSKNWPDEANRLMKAFTR